MTSTNSRRGSESKANPTEARYRRKLRQLRNDALMFVGGSLSFVLTILFADTDGWSWFLGVLALLGVVMAIRCWVKARRLKALWDTTGVILIMREAIDRDLGEWDGS